MMKHTNSHHLSPETVFKAVSNLIKGEGHSWYVSTFEPWRKYVNKNVCIMN